MNSQKERKKRGGTLVSASAVLYCESIWYGLLVHCKEFVITVEPHVPVSQHHLRRRNISSPAFMSFRKNLGGREREREREREKEREGERDRQTDRERERETDRET